MIRIIAVGILTTSCSSDPVVFQRSSFELSLISGNNQVAPVGMELADSIRIGIAPGNFRIPIELAILSGDGTIRLSGSSASGNGAVLGVQSPPDGRLSLAFTMGEIAGPNVLRVTSGFSADTILVVATGTPTIARTTKVFPRSP